jgi:very-short-patch-repair endonuclease
MSASEILVISIIFFVLVLVLIKKKVSDSNKPQPIKKDYTKSDVFSSNYREKQFTSPSKITLEAQALYYALKDRGIPVELERHDGYKTIDISIPSAKINIEVDGAHHNLNSEQALADLKRTYYSFLEGYYTLRIPNSLLRSHLEETTEYISGICNTKLKA